MPGVKPRQFSHVLERLGFVLDRQRGSHAIFRHADGRMVVVPMHPGNIPPGTLRGILTDIGLMGEDLKKLL
jgi:predicted RNA binding protein YcfA (HicA-like mRNA interferase family)